MSPHFAALRADFESLLNEWQAPHPYKKINPLDGAFALRLLLGRNPNAEELARLSAANSGITLREFLAEITRAPEFKGRVGFIPSDYILMAELPDFRFWFNTSDTEMGVRMAFGTYEPESVAFFRSVVTPGMTCWDIGAQTGFYSCLFATLAGPEGRVHGYEPMPANFALIEKNIRENRLEGRVTAKNMACSDAPGFIGMRAIANMYVCEPNDSKAIRIDCVRLDQEKIPLPGLIKIDVEGHEPAVLRGLEGVLAKCDPIIVLELNEYWLQHNSKASGASVLRWLEDHGYRAARMEGAQEPVLSREFSQDALGNCNIVARRGSRG